MAAPAAPVLLAWVAAVALWDLRTRRIPNLLVLIGLGLGILLAGMQGTWTAAISGGGLALALGIIPFALRALGGGDVKAAIVVGLFVGPHGVLKVVLVTALLSGVYASIWWLLRSYSRFKLNYTLPVGAPLCLATWGLILMA